MKNLIGILLLSVLCFSCAAPQEQPVISRVVEQSRIRDNYGNTTFKMIVLQERDRYIYSMVFTSDTVYCLTRVIEYDYYNKPTEAMEALDYNCDNKGLFFANIFINEEIMPDVSLVTIKRLRKKIRKFNRSNVVRIITDRWRAGFAFSFELNKEKGE